MCDHNGHMNVNYYYKLFDSVYTAMYFENLGFDDEYLASGFSTFMLANVNKKLLHFVGILKNENDELSAIFETVLAHMDLNARKVTEFKSTKLDELLKYKNQNSLKEDLPFELKLKIRDL